MSIDTLRTVLNALVYSRLQYGIIVWGTAHKSLLHKINLRFNKMIRVITSNTKFYRISLLYKNLKLLKLTDLYHFKLAKFFHLFIHDEFKFIIIMQDLKKLHITYLGFQNHLVKITFHTAALSYGMNLIEIRRKCTS